ncbi:hypothetical protein V6N13_060728 [Hibiscus sabdariffa]
MRLEEAKKDPKKGEVIAKKHSWKAAMDRAVGIKVRSEVVEAEYTKGEGEKGSRFDPKHKKDVEKWNERVETT